MGKPKNIGNTNMSPYWDAVRKMIKESDLVLEVLDARLMENSRNDQLESIIKEVGRPMIYVVNKSDLVSKEALELGMDKIRDQTKGEVVFVAKNKINTIKNLLAQIKKVFNKYGKHEERKFNQYTPKTERKHRVTKGDIIVSVLGYPNVGKSSLINSMSFKKKAKVSTKAGTTHGVHWIKASDEIKLIDTPGVIPLKYNDQMKLGLMGSKNPEKLKEPEVVAAKIIEMFVLAGKKKYFEDFYKIKIEDGLNTYEMLEAIGRARSHLKKGGVVDEARTAVMIVRDWQNGGLKL